MSSSSNCSNGDFLMYFWFIRYAQVCISKYRMRWCHLRWSRNNKILYNNGNLMLLVIECNVGVGLTVCEPIKWLVVLWCRFSSSESLQWQSSRIGFWVVLLRWRFFFIWWVRTRKKIWINIVSNYLYMYTFPKLNILKTSENSIIITYL